MTHHRDRALAAGVAALGQQLDRLARELAEARARGREQVAQLERRIAGLERRVASGPEPRIPLAKGAEALGVSRQHLLRLGLAGVLDVADVRAPGADRAVWTVGAAGVEALLAARRVRPGLVGRRNRPGAGRRGPDA